LVSFSAVGEPALIINPGGFLLEAKANWEHTCIAGGLFVMALPYKKNPFSFAKTDTKNSLQNIVFPLSRDMLFHNENLKTAGDPARIMFTSFQ